MGNPGPRYAPTRHNIGFRVADRVAEHLGAGFSAKYLSQLGICEVDGVRVAIAKPQTYMNESGRAVAQILRYLPVELPEGLIVIHDELDLEVGAVRVKRGGGLAGHNGLKSIVSHIRTRDFIRVRVGIGRPPSADRVVQYVLEKPTRDEAGLLDASMETAEQAVVELIGAPLDRVMTRYNRRR